MSRFKAHNLDQPLDYVREMFKDADGSGGHCEGMGQARYYAGVFGLSPNTSHHDHRPAVIAGLRKMAGAHKRIDTLARVATALDRGSEIIGL